MFLIKFVLISLVFYYLSRVLWGASIKKAGYRYQGASRYAHEGAAQTTSATSSQKPIVIGEMVACGKCGTYVAKDQGIRSREQFYCSDACQR